jgi:hypothetical protein
MGKKERQARRTARREARQERRDERKEHRIERRAKRRVKRKKFFHKVGAFFKGAYEKVLKPIGEGLGKVVGGVLKEGKGLLEDIGGKTQEDDKSGIMGQILPIALIGGGGFLLWHMTKKKQVLA